MIKSFFNKIIGSVFKKAIKGTLLGPLSTFYDIYAFFDLLNDVDDALNSVNTCSELAVAGLEVTSDLLASSTVNRLVSLGNESFHVEKTQSGIYVASKSLNEYKLPSGIVPESAFKTEKKIFVPSSYKSLSSNSRKHFSTGGKGSFISGSKGSFKRNSKGMFVPDN